MACYDPYCTNRFNGVEWFNSADISIGIGNSVTIDANTIDLEDDQESFYYTAMEGTGCAVDMCCPVLVTTEESCKPKICLPIEINIKKGTPK